MFERLGKLFQTDASPQTDESDGSVTSPAPVQTGRWSKTSIDGHEVEIFEPPSQSEPPHSCVLFLHGHGQVMLAENETFSQLLAQHNLAAIAPNGGRSWWLDELCSDFSTDRTPHNYLLNAILPAVQQRWNIEPPRVALLGISMGGQGALQLSYRNARTFPVVAAIAPAIDFHILHGQSLPLDEMFRTAEDARQATVVLNLHPLDWPRHQWFCCDPEDAEWFDGCVRLGMKLSSSGILHERDLETSAGGHSWDYFNHMAPAAFRHLQKGLTAVENS